MMVEDTENGEGPPPEVGLFKKREKEKERKECER